MENRDPDFGTMRHFDLNPKPDVSHPNMFHWQPNPNYPGWFNWLAYCVKCGLWGEKHLEWRTGTKDDETGRMVYREICPECYLTSRQTGRNGQPVKPVKIDVPEMFKASRIQGFIQNYDDQTKRVVSNYPAQHKFLLFYSDDVRKLNRVYHGLRIESARRGQFSRSEIVGEAKDAWLEKEGGRELSRQLKTVNILCLTRLEDCTFSPAWRSEFVSILHSRIENGNPIILALPLVESDETIYKKDRKGKKTSIKNTEEERVPLNLAQFAGDKVGADFAEILKDFFWVRF